MTLAPARSNLFESIPLESGPGTSGQSDGAKTIPRTSLQSWAQRMLDQMVLSLVGLTPSPSEEEKMKDEHHNHRKRKLSFLLMFLSLVLLSTGVTAHAQTTQTTQPVIEPVIDPVIDVLPAPSPTPVCSRT